MCGASGEQKSMYQRQSQFYDLATDQMKQVFGDSSAVFADLRDTFRPIVAAGPNQRGFSDEERGSLNTQATEGTSKIYEHASKALNEGLAARGGGNAFIPSGADEQLRQELASSAAENEANQKLRIVQADYDTGRDNYFRAATGLAGAPSVFNPAIGFTNAATSAGSAAADTANQITQANNSWVGAVTGALGGIAGAAVTGGFGKSKPSGPAPAPSSGGTWM
ncbi:MAG TPA: hypothetical protein VFA60_01150 [Terriglobales bacterium]|nr:hypothetical protein [Terriglobales bacterium]